MSLGRCRVVGGSDGAGQLSAVSGGQLAMSGSEQALAGMTHLCTRTVLSSSRLAQAVLTALGRAPRNEQGCAGSLES